MDSFSMEVIQDEISKAADVDQLRAFRDHLHEEFERRLLLSHSLDWNRQLNQAHDLMIAQAVQMAERSLLQETGAVPPAAYAFVLFGSGGRKEQTLWSDQDNGLIYDDPENPELARQSEAYFKTLGDRISEYLLKLGYPPCTGEVICTNDKWRKSWSEYREMMYGWLHDPHWEHMRYFLIFADMRLLYGEPALVSRLTDEMYEYCRRHPAVLEHLLHNTLHHKISLGVFGQLIKERYGEDAGGVDIKYGAYIPIVNGVRLLSVEAGIRETSTEGRILRLMEENRVEEEIAQDWLEALSIALKLRSLTPFQLEDGYYTTRGKLTADRLTKERTSELKLALRIGNDLQKFVKKSVHKEMEKG
ncbi:DUF294 nucleotidyltransferase-like domain-containing protein [Paenibacillus sp. TAB 01]|uniref:DUF294 nucleotidyltransferase-like domain-containing protein n=1 Tax=Paenibacillus sp. TAB 01 TaxID=3368988 RepID=UPI0037520D08